MVPSFEDGDDYTRAAVPKICSTLGALAESRVSQGALCQTLTSTFGEIIGNNFFLLIKSLGKINKTRL